MPLKVKLFFSYFENAKCLFKYIKDKDDKKGRRIEDLGALKFQAHMLIGYEEKLYFFIHPEDFVNCEYQKLRM